MATDFDSLDDLASAITTTLTADKVVPKVLIVDRVAEKITLTVSKGEVSGGFTSTFEDSVTLEDTLDEFGDPLLTQWTDGMAGAQLATWVRAQPSAVSNAAVLRRMAYLILKTKGVVS